MSDMGTLRRSPRLWEQQVQKRLYDLASGEATTSSPVIDGILEGTDPLDPAPSIPVTLPVPSTPTLAQGVGSVIVTWNGKDSQGNAYPTDVDVEVHVSLSQGFTPDNTTKRGVMPTGGGSSTVDGLQEFKPPQPYWFCLRAVDVQGGTAVSAKVSGYPGQVVATDIGEGVITADKVSFDARDIGGVTTGIGDTLPTDAEKGDIFLLKVRNADGKTIALKQYQFDTVWNPVEWGTEAFSAGCIATRQIVAGAITAESGIIRDINADVIKSGAINANLITAGELDARIIKVGTLEADRIKSGGTIQGNSLRTPRAPNNSMIEIGNTSGTENEDYIKFITGASTVEGQIRANDNGMTLLPGDSPIRFDRGSNPVGRSADIIFNSPAGGGNWRIFVENLPEANFSAPAFDVIGVRNSDGQLYRFPSVTTPEPQIAALQQRIADLEGRLAALEGTEA